MTKLYIEIIYQNYISELYFKITYGIKITYQNYMTKLYIKIMY